MHRVSAIHFKETRRSHTIPNPPKFSPFAAQEPGAPLRGSGEETIRCQRNLEIRLVAGRMTFALLVAPALLSAAVPGYAVETRFPSHRLAIFPNEMAEGAGDSGDVGFRGRINFVPCRIPRPWHLGRMNTLTVELSDDLAARLAAACGHVSLRVTGREGRLPLGSSVSVGDLWKTGTVRKGKAGAGDAGVCGVFSSVWDCQ